MQGLKVRVLAAGHNMVFSPPVYTVVYLSLLETRKGTPDDDEPSRSHAFLGIFGLG